VFVYDGAAEAPHTRIPTREETIANVAAGAGRRDPRTEFNNSGSPHELGPRAALAEPVVQLAIDVGLVPAHRRSALVRRCNRALPPPLAELDT